MSAIDDRPQLASSARPARRAAWGRWLAIACALAAFIVWQGSLRRPAGPDSGLEFGHDASIQPPWQTGRVPSPGRIRLGTYNIHSGRGLDGRLDLRRTAENVKGFDFLALNEVRGRGWLGTPDQAQQLGRLLESDWLFAPTEWRWWHDDFGNGALSRLLVRSWQRIPLPKRASAGCRNVLLVRALAEGRPLNLLVAHVEDTGPHMPASQLQAVVDLFLALKPPAVLLGDLNATAREPQLRRLLDTSDVTDALARINNADNRIDWIITRGLECVDCGFVAPGASDHPHFWAELKLVE